MVERENSVQPTGGRVDGALVMTHKQAGISYMKTIGSVWVYSKSTGEPLNYSQYEDNTVSFTFFFLLKKFYLF